MKQVLLFLIIVVLNAPANGQQKTLAKFVITDASENGSDITPVLLSENAYTVFYTSGNDGLIYMANYWQKSKTQSYGPMYSSQKAAYNETYETYKADIFYFKWRYINTYDTKKGTATVQLIKIYKPQGIAFTLKMLTEGLDVIIYKGYMEGTLDLQEFSK